MVMNATQPESEIRFDFLHDEAEWNALMEVCRGHWLQTGAPLRQMEVEFLELQQQLLQEDQVPAEVWDRLIEDFAQLPSRDQGLQPYVEGTNIAAQLFTNAAGSLGWRDAAALRLKLDQCWSALLTESTGSADLRDALLGVSARVASRPDFYRPTKVARDRQRSRLGMDARDPHYYAMTDAPRGTEQPKGAEPSLVRKLRLLAEWRLRHESNAWHWLCERRRFWSDDESTRLEFLRGLPTEPALDAPEFAPAPASPEIVQDAGAGRVSLIGRLWNTVVRLWNTLFRRDRVPETSPPPAPTLPHLQAPPPSIELSKVPVSRELWPGLQEWYKECGRDGARLDQDGKVQDGRIRGLEEHLAEILAGKQQLEQGINLAGLLADTTTRDLIKTVEDRCSQIEGWDNSF
jgi:hypothetical protein